ncbi:MAG: hypothetical protein U0935_02745 [Pirellulales bacterium]
MSDASGKPANPETKDAAKPASSATPPASTSPNSTPNPALPSPPAPHSPAPAAPVAGTPAPAKSSATTATTAAGTSSGGANPTAGATNPAPLSSAASGTAASTAAAAAPRSAAPAKTGGSSERQPAAAPAPPGATQVVRPPAASVPGTTGSGNLRGAAPTGAAPTGGKAASGGTVAGAAAAAGTKAVATNETATAAGGGAVQTPPLEASKASDTRSTTSHRATELRRPSTEGKTSRTARLVPLVQTALLMAVLGLVGYQTARQLVSRGTADDRAPAPLPHSARTRPPDDKPSAEKDSGGSLAEKLAALQAAMEKLQAQEQQDATALQQLRQELTQLPERLAAAASSAPSPAAPSGAKSPAPPTPPVPARPANSAVLSVKELEDRLRIIADAIVKRNSDDVDAKLQVLREGFAQDGKKQAQGIQDRVAQDLALLPDLFREESKRLDSRLLELAERVKALEGRLGKVARKERVAVVLLHTPKLDQRRFKPIFEELFLQDDYRTLFSNYELGLFGAANGKKEATYIDFPGRQTAAVTKESLQFPEPNSVATETAESLDPGEFFGDTPAGTRRRLVLVASVESQPPDIKDARWNGVQCHVLLVDGKNKEKEGDGEVWKKWQAFCRRPGTPPGDVGLVSYMAPADNKVPEETVSQVAVRLRWFIRPLSESGGAQP